jgi:alpha-methylacyl-CoA racemase
VGPLDGIRIVELAGIGPAPFCAMLLADLGGDVIRVDRPPSPGSGPGIGPVTNRSKRSVVMDLKQPGAVAAFLDLVDTADVLIEGMRPGVAERLGIGPDTCRERNERLVYGRMTGWGQEGPLRDRAGHDIDYIALIGALDAIGTPDRPLPPLNLIADFGGGALYLTTGILGALVERERSGTGQVVEAAMIDGAASLMMMFYELRAKGLWQGGRGGNLLDGGAPFYTVYEASDGGFLAVGALETQFFAELIRGLGLDGEDVPDQNDIGRWPELRRLIGAAFATKTRDEWEAVFADTDACVTPVLSMDEAPHHPHNVQRETFVDVGGVAQPAVAPRFSRTRSDAPHPAPTPGEHTDTVLHELGYDDARIASLRATGAVG